MEIQESKSVTVSNISPGANEKTVSDFFSFCGKITKLYLKKDENADTSTATVQFETESAAKTALLLTNALIVDRPITVTAFSSSSQSAASTSESTPSYGTLVDENKITQREFNVPDEQRTKTSVIASLLAAGYNLTSDAFVKAKEVDEKTMFTLNAKVAVEQVKVKAHEIDKQLGISEKAAAFEKTFNEKAKQLDESLKITETATVAANVILSTAQAAANRINQSIEANPTLKSGIESMKQTANNIKTNVQSTYQDVKDQTQKAIEEKQKSKGVSPNASLENAPTEPVTTTTTTSEDSSFVNNENTDNSEAHVNPQ